VEERKGEHEGEYLTSRGAGKLPLPRRVPDEKLPEEGKENDIKKKS